MVLPLFTWLWLTEFSGISLTCFTLSRLALFTNVSPLKPENSLAPLLTAIFVFSAKGREIYEFHALKREPVKVLGPRGGDLFLHPQYLTAGGHHREHVVADYVPLKGRGTASEFFQELISAMPVCAIAALITSTTPTHSKCFFFFFR